VPISVRTEVLSWSHHRVVASLEPHDQKNWLNTAITKHLTVAGLKKKIKEAQAEMRLVKMPTGVYRVIYADVPWPTASEFFSNYRHGAPQYPTMSLDEIRSMKLPAIADDAVLFLWATSPMLEEAFTVIRAWGFEYKTSFIWHKIRHTWGLYSSLRHEVLLVATRGTCSPVPGKRFNSVQTIKRTYHSRKPEQFRQIIDTLYPHGQRIELFARGTLPPHWDGYGDEFIETPANAAAA
jgi:N6-adenosine-specific RNA methylase IME4